MLDFIWTLSVQLRGTRNKWTLQKTLSTVGFEPPTSQGFQFSSPTTLTTRPPIDWYEIEKMSLEFIIDK